MVSVLNYLPLNNWSETKFMAHISLARLSLTGSTRGLETCFLLVLSRTLRFSRPLQPVYPLLVHLQPLPLEKHTDPSIPVLHPEGGIVPDLHAERLLPLSHALPVMTFSVSSFGGQINTIYKNTYKHEIIKHLRYKN